MARLVNLSATSVSFSEDLRAVAADDNRGRSASVTIPLADGSEYELEGEGGSGSELLRDGASRAAAVDQLLEMQASLDSHLRALQADKAAEAGAC